MELPTLSYELLGVLLLLACLHVDADSSGTALTLTASSNPTYDGSNVTLTCSLIGGSSAQQGNSASLYIEITFPPNSQDYVRCDASNTITTGGSLLETARKSCDSWSLNVSFQAKVTSAGNYTCQTTLNRGSFKPTALHLKVYEAPSSPEMSPSWLTFNDSDPMLINCTSSNGYPPAEIELKISRNGTTISNYSATATNAVLLRLNASMALHDATATCQVKNHLLPNMTASSSIKINHIFLRPGVNASQSAFEGDVLNCSKFVDSYPPPVFVWSNRSASNFTTPTCSGSFGPVGYSGNLSCTATNSLIKTSVVVTFYIEKPTTTRLQTISLSSAWMQTNASSAGTRTSGLLTSRSSSWAPAKTSNSTTIITTTSSFLSTQGSSLVTLVSGSVTSNTTGLQNNDPIIIGVSVSMALFLVAIVVTIVVLRCCRMRTPQRNLPPTQSISKMIGENQLTESQGDDAEDFVCMTDNDLYESNPQLCAEKKISIIYDEPYLRSSVSSTVLPTSQDKDSHCLLIRPQESDLIARGMDNRPAASGQTEPLEDSTAEIVMHDESFAAMGEGMGSTPPDVSATPNGTAVSVQAKGLPGDLTVSQQRFTKGKLPHNKSFDNMAYMDIQLPENNASEFFSHNED